MKNSLSAYGDSKKLFEQFKDKLSTTKEVKDSKEEQKINTYESELIHDHIEIPKEIHRI